MSGKCLGITERRYINQVVCTAAGMEQLVELELANNERWNRDLRRRDAVQIRFIHWYDNACLTNVGGGEGRRDRVKLRICNPQDSNQWFELVPTGNRGFLLINNTASKCLEVRDGSRVAPYAIQLFPCNHGWQHQVWHAVQVDELYDIKQRFGSIENYFINK